MADMRSCIKTGCRWPAAATLSYRYATAEVWLSDLGDAHPATHDLCPHHADDLRVPRGWTLVDDRRPVEAVHEPSAAEIVQRVTSLRGSVDRMLQSPTSDETRRSRYARLLDELPTHQPVDSEEEEPVAGDAEQTVEDDDRGGAADEAAPTHRRAAALVGARVSHEIAPIARDVRPGGSVLADIRAEAVADGAEDGDHAADHADHAADDAADDDVAASEGAVVLTLPLPADGEDA